LTCYSLFKLIDYLITSANAYDENIFSVSSSDLIRDAIAGKHSLESERKVQFIRSLLKADKRIIRVTDYGTGSGRRNAKKRKVSHIADGSSISGKYCRLLSLFAEKYGGDCILEFGTSLGISALCMAVSNNNARVYTMEGCPVLSEIARNNFRRAGVENAEVLTGEFEKVLPEIEKKNLVPGLVFIDGNHRGDATLKYFNRMASISGRNTVIIIDDIYYSRGMGEAWQKIKTDSRIRAAIDIYRMGIVFFTDEMPEGDYKIRY